MNNENLNDFYNQNRFNKKLRERIDSYEPELSDSLWDRIEHGLVRKESRSKRMVWMVYVMAALLLISGAGLYYLASENKKLADAVRTKDQLVPKGLNQEAPAFEYDMPETTIEITPAPTESMENPGTDIQSAPSTGGAVDNPVAIYGERNPETPGIPEPGTSDPETIALGAGSFETLAGVTPGSPANTPNASQIDKRTLRPFFYNPKPADARFLKEEISTKGLIFPRIQPYIGLTSELGSTRQKLEGTHAYRFNHEHPLLYRSAGLKAGVLLRSGLFIESGVSFSNSGSNLWYDFTPSTPPLHLPNPSPTDSLISGSRHAVNQQYWIDFPFQVGYSYRLNSHWALNAQTGMTYSMINSFSGLEPNEFFEGMNAAGRVVAQPFKNYWSMNMAFGIGYQIGKNWNIDLQGNYRKGITKMNTESRPNHPDRIAEFMSARIGISYIFR